MSIPPPPPPLTDAPEKKKPWSKPTITVIDDGVTEVGAGSDPTTTEAMTAPTSNYISS